MYELYGHIQRYIIFIFIILLFSGCVEQEEKEKISFEDIYNKLENAVVKVNQVIEENDSLRVKISDFYNKADSLKTEGIDIYNKDLKPHVDSLLNNINKLNNIYNKN